jgi:hypothetical protein
MIKEKIRLLWNAITWYIDEWYWWIRHRTIDKYHIIKLDLKPGYYDCDVRIFAALETLFLDYYKHEFRSMDDDVDNFYDDIENIHLYLTIERPKRLEYVDNLWSNMNVNIHAEALKLEEKLYSDDAEIMIKIINMRGRMWS